jgi:hypothetical protein
MLLLNHHYTKPFTVKFVVCNLFFWANSLKRSSLVRTRAEMVVLFYMSSIILKLLFWKFTSIRIFIQCQPHHHHLTKTENELLALYEQRTISHWNITADITSQPSVGWVTWSRKTMSWPYPHPLLRHPQSPPRSSLHLLWFNDHMRNRIDQRHSPLWATWQWS